jgi:hypothetical protein
LLKLHEAEGGWEFLYKAIKAMPAKGMKLGPDIAKGSLQVNPAGLEQEARDRDLARRVADIRTLFVRTKDVLLSAQGVRQKRRLADMLSELIANRYRETLFIARDYPGIEAVLLTGPTLQWLDALLVPLVQAIDGEKKGLIAYLSEVLGQDFLAQSAHYPKSGNPARGMTGWRRFLAKLSIELGDLQGGQKFLLLRDKFTIWDNQEEFYKVRPEFAKDPESRKAGESLIRVIKPNRNPAKYISELEAQFRKLESE